LQVRLARADAEGALIPERGRVLARIRAHLQHHEARWIAPLRAIADATYTFRRGFVEHVDGADPHVWPQLVAHAPLLRSARIERVLPAPMFEALCLAGFELDPPTVARLEERLVGSPLRSLEIEHPHSGDHRAIARCAALPIPLAHFGYTARRSGGGVLASGYLLQALANAPARDRLRSIALANVRLDQISGAITMLPEVEALSLAACRIGRTPANITTVAGAMPRLRSFAIEADSIANERLAAVVAACPHVIRLALRGVQVVASTIETLAPWSAQLRRLDLAGNRLDDRAVDAMLGMAWPALRSLRFPTRLLGAAAKQRLTARFGETLER
jgi:hypothetical protein